MTKNNIDEPKPNHQEFIFALATPNSIAALHLHRLSGNGIFKFLSPFIFLPGSNKNLNLVSLAKAAVDKPVTRYVIIKNKQNLVVDDVIVTLYSHPKSFTGEDTIEISTHGNPLISRQLHSLLREIGLRDAKPGEFTQRAMLNGKLDLAQAEGINQLIHAESMGAIELARNNVEGILSKETLQIRQELIEILAYLEAHIDFAPDEVGDYQPTALLPKISQIKDQLTSLFKSYENGLKIREGLKIILCGKPNSGKSSLYNALLKQEKAIVTDIPGTTRDVLEERLLIDNKDFVLLDTAGLRETEDIVEKIGVSRTFARLKEAHIICYLVAATSLEQKNYLQNLTQELTSFIHEISKIVLVNEKKIILVLNKKDLLSQEILNKISEIHSIKIDNSENHQDNILMTLTSQHDFEELKSHLLLFHSQLLEKTDTKKSPMLISQRQKDKVSAALNHIEEAKSLITLADYPEKIASLINAAKLSLEEIVGEISVDQVFEKVFSTFCIGK